MDDRFETRAIHAGQEPDPATGAVTVPIYATSTYAQDKPGQHKGYEYSRTDNPTRHALEAALASLEGVGPDGGAIAASSGMAATALIAWLLAPGDAVIIPDDAYGGTHRFFTNITAPTGVEVAVVDMTDLGALEAAITSSTKLVWLETPTNPMMRIVNLAAVNELAHAAAGPAGWLASGSIRSPPASLPSNGSKPNRRNLGIPGPGGAGPSCGRDVRGAALRLRPARTLPRRDQTGQAPSDATSSRRDTPGSAS